MKINNLTKRILQGIASSCGKKPYEMHWNIHHNKKEQEKFKRTDKELKDLGFKVDWDLWMSDSEKSTFILSITWEDPWWLKSLYIEKDGVLEPGKWDYLLADSEEEST